MGRHFWVGRGCFSWGDGGEEKAPGHGHQAWTDTCAVSGLDNPSNDTTH
jgi:hypothetical protein